MAKHTLFMGWDRPCVGREGTASELFNAVVGYLTDQQKKGNIESFEPVLLHAHGGDLNGFMLIRGDFEKLNKLRGEDQFLDLVTQVSLNVENFGVIPGFTGEGTMEQINRWRKYIR